jgi:hypothetical protein
VTSIAGGNTVALEGGAAGISRAAFLQAGAVGTVALLGMTTSGHAVRALSALVSGSPAQLARSSFSPHVGRVFRVGSAGAQRAAVRMRLTSIADIGRTRGDDRAFSLLFTASRSSTPLAGGLYAFDHPQMGRFQLAILPVGRGARVRDYEAIVNRVPGSPGRPRD